MIGVMCSSSSLVIQMKAHILAITSLSAVTFMPGAVWTGGPVATRVAWGPTGHRIVARIAERHLSARAREAVRELLGREILPEVADWADQERANPDSRWGNTAAWHWVTVPSDQTYATSTKNPDGDIVVAMRKFEAILRDPSASRTDRIDALKFLVHFVGDVHQPLHVGKPGDRGGNSIKVEWFGRPSNLHYVWDGGLIEHEKLSYTEFVEFIDDMTPGEIAEWQDSSYEDWVEESKELRPLVYGFEKPGDGGLPELSWGYQNSRIGVVEQRLRQAGIRLAGLLNSIFDSE